MRAKKRTIESDNNQDERSLSTPSHQRRRVQDVVFEVEDPFCPWNSGRYRLQADGDSVTCERTQASADLQLTAAELGAIFLGGTTLASLVAAGLVKELRPGAVATCTVAFRGEREPFCPTGREFPAY